MKFALLLLLSIYALVGCKSNSQTDKRLGTTSAFQEYFSTLDSSKADLSITCSTGTYQLIDKTYILHYLPLSPLKSHSVRKLSLDNSENNQIVELWVYKKNQASLSNFCSDLIANDIVEPKEKIKVYKGELVFAYSDSVLVHGNRVPVLSIHVKQLQFKHPKTNKIIEFKNKLIWKNPNLGTPG